MLNAINSNLDSYYKICKYNKKKFSSKDSFADKILKDNKHKEEKVNDFDKTKQKEGEDSNIESKIITAADGTRTLLLIKNASIITQIKLGKAIDQLKEENQKDTKREDNNTCLNQSTRQSGSLSNSDTV